MALATCLAVLSVVVPALAACGYLAEAWYSSESTPRSLEFAPGESEQVRARYIWDSVDGRSVTVLVAQPVVPGASPPPGLDTWPKPGQFVYSPSLRGDARVLAARWGTPTGVIADEALPARNSRIIVARPATDLSAEWAAAGFGVPDFAADVIRQTLGDNANRIPLPIAIGGIVGAVVLPAMALLVVCIRRLNRAQAQQNRILEVLGATPRALTRRFFGRLLPATLAGCVGAGIGLLALHAVDLPLPFAGFTIRAIDVRAGAWLCWACWLVGSVVAVLLSWVASRPAKLGLGQLGRRRPAHARPLLATIAAVGIVATSGLAHSIAGGAAQTGDAGDLGLWLLIAGGVAAGGVGLISFALVRSVGGWVARLSASWGRPLGLLVGTSFRHRGGAMTLAAISALTIVLITFAGTWTLSGSVEAVSAQRVIDRINSNFYLLTGPGDPPGRSERVLANLPEGVSALTLDETTRVVEGIAQSSATVYGSKAALRHWNLHAGESQATESLPGLLGSAVVEGAQRVAIRVGPAPQAAPANPDDPSVYVDRSFVAFRMDGRPVDRDSLQRAVTAAGGIEWEAGQGGELWIIGAKELAHSLRWVPWFAALGSAIALAALWLGCLDDIRRSARRVVPVDVLYARRSVVPWVVALRIVAVTLAACLVGGVTAVLLARIASGDLTVTQGAMPFVGGSIGVVAAVSLAAAAAGASGARRTMQTWRPGGGESE